MAALSAYDRINDLTVKVNLLQKLVLKQAEHITRLDDRLAEVMLSPPSSAIPDDLTPPLARMRDIAQRVAARHMLSVADLRGKKTIRPVAYARHEAMMEMVDAGFSQPQIGRFLNRDSTTVCSGAKAARMRMQSLISLQGNCAGDKLSGQGGATNASPCPGHSEPTGEVRTMPYDGKYPISARIFNPEQTGGEA